MAVSYGSARAQGVRCRVFSVGIGNRADGAVPSPDLPGLKTHGLRDFLKSWVQFLSRLMATTMERVVVFFEGGGFNAAPLPDEPRTATRGIVSRKPRGGTGLHGKGQAGARRAPVVSPLQLLGLWLNSRRVFLDDVSVCRF
jgi:hypothetical protein